MGQLDGIFFWPLNWIFCCINWYVRTPSDFFATHVFMHISPKGGCSMSVLECHVTIGAGIRWRACWRLYWSVFWRLLWKKCLKPTGIKLPTQQPPEPSTDSPQLDAFSAQSHSWLCLLGPLFPWFGPSGVGLYTHDTFCCLAHIWFSLLNPSAKDTDAACVRLPYAGRRWRWVWCIPWYI